MIWYATVFFLKDVLPLKTEKERDLPTTGSLPKYTQWPMEAQATAGQLEIHWNTPTWVMVCVPGHISRELQRDMNHHFSVAVSSGTWACYSTLPGNRGLYQHLNCWAHL